MGLFARLFFLIVIGLAPLNALALRFTLNITTPFIFIQIGHGQMTQYGLFGPPAAQVDEVTFTFPGGVLPGDGTPIVGTPVIPVAVIGFSTLGRPSRTTYIVTMNSSAPLTNGNGDTLPFDQISWTTQDGDIPGGTFDQGAAQTLLSLNRRGRRARGVVDYLTFTYSNTSVYAAGTYTGRVVYTIALL